jgi:hypothetical protein
MIFSRTRVLAALVLALALLAYPARDAMSQLASTYLFSQASATWTPINGTVLLTNQYPFAYDATLGYGYDLAVTTATNIGFNFKFAGQTYTTFRASTSGVLMLGNPTVSDIRTNDIGAPPISSPIITAFWEQQHVYDGGCMTPQTSGIRYEVSGVAPYRVLTVQWRTGLVMGGSSYYSYSCPSTQGMYNYQVRLQETTGGIEFHYASMYSGALTSTVSIGLANGTGNFMSVTPGSPATVSSSTPNNSVYMNTTPIVSGTIYQFTPCGFELTPRLGTGNGGTSTLANGDDFFVGFSTQRGSVSTYSPFDLAVPGGVCPNRTYTATIAGAGDYFFGTPGTTSKTVTVTAGAPAVPFAINFAPIGNGQRNAVLTFTDVANGVSRTFNLRASATPRITYTGRIAEGGTVAMANFDSLMLNVTVLRRTQASFRPMIVNNANATPNFDANPVPVTVTIDSAGVPSYQYTMIDPVTGTPVSSLTKLVAPGDTFSPRILFRASSAGKQVARMVVTNPDGENRTYYLGATSSAPAGRFEILGQSALNTAQFATITNCVGESFTTLPMIVTNTGYGALVLNGFDAYATDTVYRQGTPPVELLRDARMRVVPSGSYGIFDGAVSAPLSNNASIFPITIPEGQSRTILVTFVPNLPGKRWARAFLRTNAQNFSGTDTTYGTMPGTIEGLVNFDLVGTGVGGQLAADASGQRLRTAVFAATRVGDSTDLALPITNSGACDLRISRRKLRIFSGDVNEIKLLPSLGAARLDGATNDYVIAAHATDTLRFRFKPSRAGTRMATLWIQTNDSTINVPGLVERGAYYLDLHGKGLAGLDGTELVLAPVVIGNSVDGVGVLENTQTVGVGVQSIAFSGGDAAEFSAVNWPALPTTVLPGQKLLLGVRLTPTGNPGARRTTIVLATTTGDTVRLPVRGEAGTQTLLVSPASLFDNVTLAVGQSVRQTLLIANTGTLPVRLSSVQISGPDATNYRLGQMPRADLDAGQTEYLEVTFAPSASGQSSAQIDIVASNGQTYTVPLGGTALKVRRNPNDQPTTSAPNGDVTPGLTPDGVTKRVVPPTLR